MATINDDEIAAAGLDNKIVRGIARRIESAAKEAGKHGIIIFGAAGSGQLMFNDRHDAGNLVLAEISSGIWSGGDGNTNDEFDGLQRGEF